MFSKSIQDPTLYHHGVLSDSSDSDQNRRFVGHILGHYVCKDYLFSRWHVLAGKVIKCNNESFSETRSECLITKRCKMDVMISQEKDVNLKTFSIIQLERK